MPIDKAQLTVYEYNAYSSTTNMKVRVRQRASPHLLIGGGVGPVINQLSGPMIGPLDATLIGRC